MTEVETPPLRVRELRRERGWNQTELAYRAGTSPSSISHLETGNHVPNLRYLARVAAALGVEVRDLFVESPDEGPLGPPSGPDSEARPQRPGFDAGEVARRGPDERAVNPFETVLRQALRAADARLRYLEQMGERIERALELMEQETADDELRAKREQAKTLAAELEADAAAIGDVARELRLRAKSA